MRILFLLSLLSLVPGDGVYGRDKLRDFDIEAQLYTDFEPYTRTVRASGLCIRKFEILVYGCIPVLTWDVESIYTLEESNGGEWYEIPAMGTEYIDDTPSKFYRLSCGDDVEVVVNYNWCHAPYWLIGIYMFINTEGYYEIYDSDGKMLLDTYLYPGMQLALIPGVYLVVFNGSAEIVIVHE